MKRFAIFIGINAYGNDITPLRCACNDASELFGEFKAAGFDKTVLIPENEAKSSELINKVRNFCEEMKDGDMLVFYFAGHGRELNNEHYLVAKDGFADPNLYSMGSLPMSVLVNVTNKPGVRRLFILDCCRDNLLAGRSTAFVCDKSRSIALNNAVKMQSGFIPPLILNSCSSGEKAFEDTASGHGYFTKALLKTIGDTAIKNFSVFRQQLNRNMNSSGTQNICWNGNVDDWDEVKLFDSWNAAPVPPVAPAAIPDNFYELQWDVQKWQKRLEQNQIELSEELQKLLFVASRAEQRGDYASAVRNLQKFVTSAKNLFDAERKAREEVERKAKIEAERKAREEAERKAKIEAERKAKAEARKYALKVLEFSADGKTVTGVKDKNITSIVIPDGVTTIGDRAFEDCTSLTSVTIPNSVTTIGDRAFEDCTSLTSVTIPDGVTAIWYGAFLGCKSLTSVTIPASVTTIDDRAFCGVKSVKVSAANKNFTVDTFGALIDSKYKRLRYFPSGFKGEYIIPSSVKTIGDYAFADCTSLTSVTIPSSVTTIGEFAFGGCTSLTRVTIPPSVTTIGACAFDDCRSLTSVTIPSSVTTIGCLAFAGCTSLTNVTIPNSVTTIVYRAFAGCTSLTSVTIPSSVKKIDSGAFSGCTSLTSVLIPRNCKYEKSFFDSSRDSFPKGCEVIRR